LAALDAPAVTAIVTALTALTASTVLTAAAKVSKRLLSGGAWAWGNLLRGSELCSARPAEHTPPHVFDDRHSLKHFGVWTETYVLARGRRSVVVTRR